MGQAQAAGQAPAQPQTSEPATAPQASDALTWHGITLYGAYDVGFGWVSHGLPENGYNYEGESLVNRNGYKHRFLIAPNNLQQTGLPSSTLPPASTRSPACWRTRPGPTLSTTGFHGAAIRLPSTAHARASLSTTNTMAGFRLRRWAR
jgi:hypothetical protein